MIIAKSIILNSVIFFFVSLKMVFYIFVIM